MAQRFTINLNGKRGCDELISEVQWMNGLYVAKHLHVQAQKHTCTHDHESRHANRGCRLTAACGETM